MIKEYAKYIKVLTTSGYYNKDEIVKFIENHDSYYHLGWTKNIPSKEISYRYKDLSKCYPNTIYFARPYDQEWRSPEVRQANSNLSYKKIYKY